MFKRTIALIGATMLLATMFTSCGNSNSGKDSYKANEADTAVYVDGVAAEITEVKDSSALAQAGLPKIETFDDIKDAKYYNIGDKISQIVFTDDEVEYTYRAIKGDSAQHGHSEAMTQTASFAVDEDFKCIGYAYSLEGSEALVGIFRYDGIAYSVTCENGGIGSLIGMTNSLAKLVMGIPVDRTPKEEVGEWSDTENTTEDGVPERRADLIVPEAKNSVFE